MDAECGVLTGRQLVSPSLGMRLPYSGDRVAHTLTELLETSDSMEFAA